MGTYRLQDYPKVLKARARKLNKLKSPYNAAGFMVKDAIALAPKRSGETIRGIRRIKIKRNKYLVESKVSGKPYSGGKFYQNLWANRSAVGGTNAPRMRWNKMQPTVYGKGKARWTGVPRFFKIAVLNTRKRYPELVRKELIQVMRS